MGRKWSHLHGSHYQNYFKQQPALILVLKRNHYVLTTEVTRIVFYNFSTHQQRHRTVLPKNRSSSDNGRTRNKMSRNPLQPKQLFIGKPSSVKRVRTANESISRSKIHNNREKNRKILKFSSENLQVIPDRRLNLFQLKINRP